MSKLSKLTVAELRDKLRAANLPVSGRKDLLIERLEDYYNEHGKEESDDEGDRFIESDDDVGSEDEIEQKKFKRKTPDSTDPQSLPPKKKSKVTIKVDPYCNLRGSEVYEDWGVTLNQTNIRDNNNKYYIIQLLKSGSGHYCFTRWGRVGEKGRNDCKYCGSLDSAQEMFSKKFKDKTKNNWDTVRVNRDSFRSVPKQYTLLDMDHGEEEEEENDEKEEKKELETKSGLGSKPIVPVRCALPKATQSLIKLIFDNDMFKEQMIKLDLDVKRLPLGALSKTQINKGYACLDKLAEAIHDGDKGAIQGLTSSFYTLIPHSFGRTRPPLISDAETVQTKRDMLSVLGDIEIAQSLTKEDQQTTETVDPLTRNYNLLDADLEPVEPGSEEYKYIDTYLHATKNRKLEIIDLFKVNRKTEPARFSEFDSMGNRKLLWHGTNVAVVVAILKTGLRIMPHSGGRVGKGIYFASENAKSSNYVGPVGDIGIMFLNEVVLGKEHHIVEDDPSLTKPPRGYDSIIAKGWTEPDPSKDIIMNIDGHKVVVPQGNAITIPQYNKSSFSQSEYLVYHESQCRIRYLLKLKWQY